MKPDRKECKGCGAREWRIKVDAAEGGRVVRQVVLHFRSYRGVPRRAYWAWLSLCRFPKAERATSRRRRAPTRPSSGSSSTIPRQPDLYGLSGPDDHLVLRNAKLLKAARQGDELGLRELLEAGAELGARDEKGRTPLMLAALSGCTACVKSLLVARADVRAGDNEGHTPLMGAAMNGNDGCLPMLLSAGALLEARTQNDNTPLLLAAGAGHAACVKSLLQAGAAVDARNKNGCTPLLWAARGGCCAVVEQLLESGADKDARDLEGKSALELAREREHRDTVALFHGTLQRTR